MADDSEQIGQDEIEALLNQAQAAGGAEETPAAEPPPAEDASVDQAEIEALLGSASSPAPPTGAVAPTTEDVAVDQAEIEALLGGAAPPAQSTPTPPAATAPASAKASAGNLEVSQNDIELLLNKAEQALASVDQESGLPPVSMPAGVRTFEFQKFSGTAANADSATLELMRDVELDMTIELGRTHMHLEDVLQLKQGSVVPLDKLAGDPADIYVNGRLVARGEVLVLNDNFCVRVAELVVGESACA